MKLKDLVANTFFSSVLPHQWSEIRLSLLFIFFLRSYQAAWELLVNTVSAGKVEYRIWLKFYDKSNHLFILINQIDLYESKNNFPHFLHCKSGIYQSWKNFRFFGTNIETAILCEKSLHAGDALILPNYWCKIPLFLKHNIMFMGVGYRQRTSWAGGIHLGFACLFCYVLLIDSR